MVGEKIWMSMVARARKAALEAGYRTQNEKAIEALIAEAVTLRNELETALRNTDQEAEALLCWIDEWLDAWLERQPRADGSYVEVWVPASMGALAEALQDGLSSDRETNRPF